MVDEGYSHMDLAKPMDVDYTTLLVSLARYKFVIAQLKKSDAVLDIGCGTGYGTYYMSKFCRRATGIDIDKGQVGEANRQFQASNLNFEHVDLLGGACRFLENQDVITCFEVIQDMPKEKALNFLKLIGENKKRNAVVFISTPRRVDAERMTENRVKYHPHEYDYSELRDDLESVFGRAVILGQLDEFIGSLNKNNVWTYFVICV